MTQLDAQSHFKHLDFDRAQAWLKSFLSADAAFRPGQWDAIERLVAHKERLLVVQRTGWGKSLVYFLATRYLRAQGSGVTILISPLLSLMRDQIRTAENLNLRAVTINSTNYDDHAQIEQQLLRNEIDLLLISPERLANANFQQNVWLRLKRRIGLLVIDEAHCISDWGHDFRPNYRRIMHILNDLSPQTPVLATTATANDRVVQDVSEIIGTNVHVIRGPLTRQSLRLYVYREVMSQAYRLALLAYLMDRLPGSGIIYCTTTRDCLRVANWLQSRGYNAQPYYANVQDEVGLSREELEHGLMHNEVKALVASVALGMGFDKPDLSFVIHYQMAGSIVGYYQQIGRAGRAIDRAHIILMHGTEDLDIQKYFIETAFPSRQQVEQTIGILRQHGALKRTQLEQYVNARRSTLEKILTHLEVEGIIQFDVEARQYRLVNAQHQPDYARWQVVTQRRYDELQQMQDYMQHPGCMMQYIARALDDPTAVEPCGRCRNCTGVVSTPDLSAELIESAARYARQGEAIYIQPRKKWPSGFDKPWNGRIKPCNETGYVLCHYFDEGWGRYVREGKYQRGVLADELVAASLDLLQPVIREHGIQWVTAVTSLRHPHLVPNFAKRLATALKLPYVQAVETIKEHPPQKEMQNSFRQVQNLLGTFRIANKIPATPVLLVDDMVDSGWTLTMIGELLRQKGCPAVYPFALASMS